MISVHCYTCGDDIRLRDEGYCETCVEDQIVRRADEAAYDNRPRTKKAEMITVRNRTWPVSEPSFGDNGEDVQVAYYADELGRGGSDDHD